mgnify:CR=1 FL=1
MVDGLGERFEQAIARFDRANAEDPNLERVDGVDTPKELVYAHRMSERLACFAPDAPEPLRLAARSQHIRRWTIPRAEFPEGRDGYREWRTRLAAFHADTAGTILRDLGYGNDVIARVESLLRKERLKADADAQTLEDVACLVFLEHQAAAFASQHDEAKLVDILRKTWRKMSERGRAVALDLKLAPAVMGLLKRAVG